MRGLRFREARGRRLERDVLAHEVVVIRVGAREADHPPGVHAAVAAVGRIAEVALHGEREQQLEKLARARGAEVHLAALQGIEVAVLRVRVELLENVADVVVDGG